jgi:hypothetical protein
MKNLKSDNKQMLEYLKMDYQDFKIIKKVTKNILKKLHLSESTDNTAIKLNLYSFLILTDAALQTLKPYNRRKNK